jgi:uncharacterized membrane protein HdeD (DUF308 family)
MSAMDESTALRSRTRAALWRLAGPWWMFLLTGIAWLLVSVLILRITTASVATVGVLMGVLFLVAMLNEWFIAAVSPSWRWAHIVLGVLFAAGAVWAFARPYNAFWALASVLGLLLILRGTFDIISAVVTKDINSAWWLGMLVGILEILLGFWASQQRLPVQGALLLVWVGFFALFRGISEIVVAFELRSAQRP